MFVKIRATGRGGALGCAQLERHATTIAKRKENGAYFNKHLAQFGVHLQLPTTAPGAEHVFMMYPIVIKKSSPIQKADMVQYLEEHKIETRDMLPLINQPLYKELYGDLEAQYPVAKWINNNGFYIGCHQMLPPADRERIVSVFMEFLKFRALGVAKSQPFCYKTLRAFQP